MACADLCQASEDRFRLNPPRRLLIHGESTSVRCRASAGARRPRAATLESCTSIATVASSGARAEVSRLSRSGTSGFNSRSERIIAASASASASLRPRRSGLCTPGCGAWSRRPQAQPEPTVRHAPRGAPRHRALVMTKVSDCGRSARSDRLPHVPFRRAASAPGR